MSFTRPWADVCRPKSEITHIPAYHLVEAFQEVRGTRSKTDIEGVKTHRGTVCLKSNFIVNNRSEILHFSFVRACSASVSAKLVFSQVKILLRTQYKLPFQEYYDTFLLSPEVSSGRRKISNIPFFSRSFDFSRCRFDLQGTVDYDNFWRTWPGLSDGTVPTVIAHRNRSTN